MNEVRVSVCVLSYNHERFLRQCLDSIFMQQVSFPFEVRVHDDASTDMSQFIIREYQERYPFILKPILQHENQYSKDRRILKNFLFPLCKGKYIALCEGDDYWYDPLKLQKQVDYMESHPDCAMCFGKAIEHWEDGTKPDKVFTNIEDRDYSGIEISDRWIVPTASVLFKKSITECRLYDSLSSNKSIIYGDLPLWLTCAQMGTIHGFSDVFSVYRRIRTGFMLSIDAQKKISMGDTRVELYRVFGKKYRNTCIGVAMGYYQSAYFDAKKERNMKLIMRSLWKSVCIRITHPDMAFSHLKLFLQRRKGTIIQKFFRSNKILS